MICRNAHERIQAAGAGGTIPGGGSAGGGAGEGRAGMRIIMRPARGRGAAEDFTGRSGVFVRKLMQGGGKCVIMEKA